MDRNNHEYLLGEAARRCARLSAPDCSEAERAEHARWLQCDPAHRTAIEQIERASLKIDQALEVDRRLQVLADEALAAGAHETSHGRRQSSFALASTKPKSRTLRQGVGLAAAAVVVCAFAMVLRFSGVDALRSAHVLSFEASSHRIERFALPDGSIVHLDAGGKLRARFSASNRDIELLNGRAFFEVAHDASRPFAVSANNIRTVALGTRFEVRCDLAGAAVTLAEGSVAVSDVHGGWTTRLQPGEQLDVSSATSDVKVRNVDPHEVTDWSRGWLKFRDASLEEVLSNVNRYSFKQVVVADDSLLQLRVAGSFAEGDAQSIVDAIAEVLPIRAVDGGNHEIILFKRYEN